MNATFDTVLPHIVEQHYEETAFLLSQRWLWLNSSNVSLHTLGRLDQRLATHIDGLRVADSFGKELAINAAQEKKLAGTDGFAAILLLLEEKNIEKICELVSAEVTPNMIRSVTSAFGWVSSQFLQGSIKTLLNSADPLQLLMGIECCALHRVNPGRALELALNSDDIPLKSRALEAVGELGRRDLLPFCEQFTKEQHPDIRFWAAWSAALLSEKKVCIAELAEFSSTPNKYQLRALQILLKTLPSTEAHVFLQNIAKNPTNQRILIQGAGISGDPFYIPWLIKQMADLKLARLAGEAFSFITGLDLAYLDLERKPPENFESGPNDNPEDPNVDLDPDDNLPWPDPDKINHWWGQNAARFTNGTRYFMGETISRPHCINVLKTGFQRQRIAAALYLSLLNPGEILFPTSAPAWRQERLLKKLF